MKKKFVVVAVLGTLVIGGVAGLYATTGDQREQAAKLEQNREDARNAGLPITVYELFPAETIDQEQNSAPLIIEASTLLDTDPETALEILLAIKDKSSCDFDHQVALDSDFVGSLRFTDAVELLMSSASKNLENEEFDDFSAKVTAAEKIASHVASIPKPDALYASAMAERELLTTFGRLLHEYPKHKQLIQLSQEVGEKTRPLGVLKRSLRYGVVSGIETVSSMRQATLPGRLQSSYPVDPWGHAAVESKHLKLGQVFTTNLIRQTVGTKRLKSLMRKPPCGHRTAAPLATVSDRLILITLKPRCFVQKTWHCGGCCSSHQRRSTTIASTTNFQLSLP